TSVKSDDVPNAPTSVMPEDLENVVPETPEDVPATGNKKSPTKVSVDEENLSDDRTVVNSSSNESVKIGSTEKGDTVPADQG
ncbi:hypothetical protein A2U01_0091981, partial [Trifolium medium]|nr:hypothetical protein [Trifolium medium]